MENTEKNSFITKFADFAAKLGNQIHLRTLRDAFATIMPLYILAGLAVLLNNTVFTWIFSGETLETFQYWGNLLVNGTLNISGLLIAGVIGYCLAINREFENPISCAVVAIAGLVVMMPMTVELTSVNEITDTFSGVLPFSNLGTGSMFAGIIVGLLITEFFIWISRVKALQINLGANVPPAVGKSFNVLIPVIIVLSVFAVVSTLLGKLAGTDLITLITTFIQAPLRHIGTSLWGTVILYTLGNLLWLFGIHQSVIYSSILEPLLIININENIAAFAAGEAIPNIINVSQVTSFGLLGGSGSTILSADCNIHRRQKCCHPQCCQTVHCAWSVQHQRTCTVRLPHRVQHLHGDSVPAGTGYGYHHLLLRNSHRYHETLRCTGSLDNTCSDFRFPGYCR